MSQDQWVGIEENGKLSLQSHITPIEIIGLRDGSETDTETTIDPDSEQAGTSAPEDSGADFADGAFQQPDQRVRSIREKRRPEVDQRIGRREHSWQSRVLPQSQHEFAPVEGRDFGESDGKGTRRHLQHAKRQHPVGEIGEESADATTVVPESGRRSRPR